MLVDGHFLFYRFCIGVFEWSESNIERANVLHLLFDGCVNNFYLYVCVIV